MLKKGGACWVQAKELMAMMFCGKNIVFFLFGKTLNCGN
jgi:hypothetical protein